MKLLIIEGSGGRIDVAALRVTRQLLNDDGMTDLEGHALWRVDSVSDGIREQLRIIWEGKPVTVGIWPAGDRPELIITAPKEN